MRSARGVGSDGQIERTLTSNRYHACEKRAWKMSRKQLSSEDRRPAALLSNTEMPHGVNEVI